MALAKSVTFQADKDAVFASALEIVQAAGYAISEIDDAARRITYYVANPGGFLHTKHKFAVTITVSSALGGTITSTLFSMKTVAIETINIGFIPNSRFEGELVNFITNELKKQYKTVASGTTIANAPGAG